MAINVGNIRVEPSVASGGSIHANSSGGHSCPRCGAWVPNFFPHKCPDSVAVPGPPPMPLVDQQAIAQTRIADALDRIASALEKLMANDDG